MDRSAAKHKNNLDSAYEFAASTLLHNDRDLYRLCLYEKNIQKRRAFISVWALMTEIEKIPTITTESQMGLLRIKWWYDALSQSKDDQTLILNALKDNIEKGALNQVKLLNLIDHMQGEITLPKDAETKNIAAYHKRKAHLMAACLGEETYEDIWARLLLTRAAPYHPELIDTMNNAPIATKDKKKNIHSKTMRYCQTLRNKITQKKLLTLTPWDLIRLHFCK